MLLILEFVMEGKLKEQSLTPTKKKEVKVSRLDKELTNLNAK
jgi:hypothetical protein